MFRTGWPDRTRRPPMIETPCVKICTLDAQRRQCLGCGRTVDEIGRWAGMTSADRRRVMDELPGRMAALKAQTDAIAG